MANVFDLGGSVQQGLQMGSAIVAARKANAINQLNPNDPNYLGQLAQYDQSQALQLQNQLAEAARKGEVHALDMQLGQAKLDEIARGAEKQPFEIEQIGRAHV